MAGTITVGELLSDPTSNNKITIGSGTTLDFVSGAGSVLIDRSSVSGAGKVLQVVIGTNSTNVSPEQPQLGGAGMKFISQSIVPTSATSKILCLVEASIEANSGNYSALYFEMRRDSTSLRDASLVGYRGNAQTHVIMTRNWSYLDSPASTSTLEYSGWIANTAGSGYGSSTYSGRANGYGTSRITLIEVAG